MKLTATASCLAALACAPAAYAAVPPEDPGHIITVQIENDALSIPGTDRFYTSGERLGYVGPTSAVPDFVSSWGHSLFGQGTQRLSFDLQQVIYTPTNTQVYNPDPKDRPYAGQLAVRFSLIQDTTETRSLAGVSLGIIGPASLAQSVQNGFHKIIGDKSNNGWKHQLHTEPTLDFYAGRIWRYDLAEYDGIGLQALPQLTAQLGNTEIYAQAGGIVRFGQGLDSDFGPALIQPQVSGTDAYTPTRPFVWYLFGGVMGRAVAHDTLVQGNNFRSSRGVSLTPLQGSLQVGGAIIVRGVRISAEEVFTTPEFHNAAPAFQYGSVAVSFRF